MIKKVLDRLLAGGDPALLKHEIVTLPNILSMIRILLVPVFIWAMMAKRPHTALIIFTAAGLTDALDGLLARALKMRSLLGVWLDPIGDKLLLVSGFVMLSIPSVSAPYCLPVWLPMICIGRDVLISAAAIIINVKRGFTTFHPTILGKSTTVAQVALLFIVLLGNSLGRHYGVLPGFFYVTATLTVLSGIEYTGRELKRTYYAGDKTTS